MPDSEEVRAVVALVDALRSALAEAKGRPGLPDSAAPCFGHMRIRTDRGPRDVLLGYHAFSAARHGVVVVDWRSSPIARVFHCVRPGENYEEEVDGRVFEGRLEVRHRLVFEGGRLVRVEDDDGAWRPGKGGAWAPVRGADPTEATAAGLVPPPRAPHSPITALLDADQVRALSSDNERPLLVLGSAGSGKTTVALHRLASLVRAYPDRFPAERVQVVVPEEGLARLVRLLLRELGLGRTRVDTFDSWIRERSRRAFGPDLPARICGGPPAHVVRFKRHPAFLDQIPAFVERRVRSRVEVLDHGLLADGALLRAWESRSERPHALRLRRLRDAWGERKDRFDTVLRGLFRVVEDWSVLLQDQEVLDAAVEASGGDLTRRDLEAVRHHTWIQRSPTTEEAFSHVDADRLATLDGQPIDAGTAHEHAGTLDIEDYALLFEIRRLKTGGHRPPWYRLPRHPHLTVDEVQDLALGELAVLGGARLRDSALTLAGDVAQQVDPTLAGSGWPRILSAIAAEGAAPVTLRTPYRCPAPVAALGQAVLGPLASPDFGRPGRPGPPVIRTHHPDRGSASAVLIGALHQLLERAPHASVAIICLAEATARLLAPPLERDLDARLVLHGDFRFGPGVEVTVARRVKGLEFDLVVIPDADRVHCPADSYHRRLLHVAITRARHQVWLSRVGPPSGLLPR